MDADFGPDGVAGPDRTDGKKLGEGIKAEAEGSTGSAPAPTPSMVRPPEDPSGKGLEEHGGCTRRTSPGAAHTASGPARPACIHPVWLQGQGS